MKYLFYLLKIWIVTILFGPILFFGLEGATQPNFEWKILYDLGQLVLLASFIGGLLSIPTFIVMGYYLVLVSYKKSSLFNKIILSCIGFFGTFFTFAALDYGSFSNFDRLLLFPLSYASILVISVGIFYSSSLSNKS